MWEVQLLHTKSYTDSSYSIQLYVGVTIIELIVHKIVTNESSWSFQLLYTHVDRDFTNCARISEEFQLLHTNFKEIPVIAQRQQIEQQRAASTSLIKLTIRAVQKFNLLMCNMKIAQNSEVRMHEQTGLVDLWKRFVDCLYN